LFVDFITRRSRIKPDAAIGIALSFFFAIGIVLLTFIQQTGMPGQSGLNNFLLGKAAAMSPEDIRTMSLVSIIVVGTVAVFFKPLRIISFDPDFAKASGMPVRFYETLLTTLTVLAVAVGIQAVGVVLMAALLITPPAAARFWTNKLGFMILLAILFGVLGGISGAYISFVNNKMPTGPWVVTMTSLLVVFSILFAPGKGVLARWWKKKRYRRKVQRENLLKALFHLEEASPGKQWFSLSEIVGKRPDLSINLMRIIRLLQKRHLLEAKDNTYSVTAAGLLEGKRIVRIHRLWEIYLTEKMNIASDHVHEDAEAIEHIITPEMEARLAALLDYPEKDPHNKDIPW
jgi:manganese/zinc/iron transport system permease protein